jgi:hypothetical protein
MGRKTELQSFVTNTRRFLNGDLVAASEESDWRIYGDDCSLGATQLEGKVEFSSTIGHGAISKVTDSRFMVTHTVSSLGATDGAQAPAVNPIASKQTGNNGRRFLQAITSASAAHLLKTNAGNRRPPKNITDR